MAKTSKLKRLAEYYECKKNYERAGDVFFAAETWDRALTRLKDAARLNRLGNRYEEARRCYVKAALAADRLDKDDRADQLERRAAECEQFLKQTDLSKNVGRIPGSIERGAEVQAKAKIRSAEITRDGRLEAQRMWIEGFREVLTKASERLFEGLQQISAVHSRMARELSQALIVSFEKLSNAHREAVLEHGGMMLEGLRTLSKATVAGHLIEAISCLKQGEMLSEAEKQKAIVISEGVCHAGKDVRQGLESNARSILDAMSRASQAVEVHGKLMSEATRYASDVEVDALMAIAEELGVGMARIDEGVRKHSRVLRTSIMGGLFGDQDRGFLKSLIWDWPTQRAFRPGIVQATKQLGANIDGLALPPPRL